MLNQNKPSHAPGINTEVSEYLWDVKTQRFKPNSYYRTGRIAIRYLFWGAAVLLLGISVVWCLMS